MRPWTQWLKAGIFSTLLAATGCAGLDTVVISETREVALPAPKGSGALRLLPLHYEHSSAIPRSDVDPKSIDRVTLTRLEIVLPTPSSTRNLAFIRELNVYVQAPGQPKVLVASSDELPEQANAVSLELEEVDLREYLIHEGGQILAEFRGIQPPEQLNVHIEADFLVDVSLSEILF